VLSDVAENWNLNSFRIVLRAAPWPQADQACRTPQ
jgi:hypothetical protein